MRFLVLSSDSITQTRPRRNLWISLLHPVWAPLGSRGTVGHRFRDSLRYSLCKMNPLLSRCPVSICCMVSCCWTFSGFLSSQTAPRGSFWTHRASPSVLVLSSYANRTDWRSRLERREAQPPDAAAGSAQQNRSLLSPVPSSGLQVSSFPFLLALPLPWVWPLDKHSAHEQNHPLSP